MQPGSPWAYLCLHDWEGRLSSSRQPSACIPPTGESNTVVSPTVPGGLSDGQWHTVRLRYYNKVGTILGLGVWGELGCQVLPLSGHPGGPVEWCAWVSSPGQMPWGVLRAPPRTRWLC